MSTVTVTDGVRERLLADHEATLREALACATDVAASWDGGATTDRSSVVEPLAAALERRGVRDDLIGVLETAAGAVGEDLPTHPVPRPPYVVVTSRGPMVRATLPEGRLVVTLAAFEVERDPVRYVHLDPTVADALEVRYE